MAASQAPGAELREKLRSFGARAEAGGRGAVQVARGAWPAPAAAAFRSGWVRSPELSAPHLAPAAQGGSAARRAGSDPGASRRSARGATGCAGHGAGSDAGSDAGDSVASGAAASSRSGFSEASLQRWGGSGSHPCLADAGARHAGWLAKRTSAKVGARWLPRYFALDGLFLRYAAEQGGPWSKTLFVGHSSRVGLSAGDPCEIELELASRVWRLRAEDPSAARQWLVLLQAARLLGSRAPAGEGGAEGAAPSGSGTPRSPGTPSFGGAGHAAGGRVSVPEVDQEAAAAAAHRLSRAAGALAPRLASRPPRAGARALGEQLGPGLDAALDALWQRLAALAAPPGAPGVSGPSAAAATLCSLPPPAPDAVDRSLGEYVRRLLENVARWVEAADPCADTVLIVAQWWLIDMRPALDAFERGMAGAAAEWHAAASEVDRVLLSEWEARQCEEMFHLCERVYSPAEAALRDTVATGYVSSDVVRAIRAVACQRSDWRGHPVACDRSASVLIACLSTALRATRCHARVVLAPQVQEPPAALGRAGLQRALAACSGAEPEPEPGLSRRLAAAANEAAELALICREAKAADGSSSPMSTPSGVLGSFAAAFEEAAAALCDGLARQFAGTHRHALRAASAAAWPACGHGARAAAPPQTPRGQERSALEGPCAAATRFLEETLDGGPALAARLACEALLRLLVRRWARRFCRGARRPAGVAAVLAQVAADEGALDRLAATWGVAARRASGGSDPVRPLREVCGILAAPQPDAEARAGAGRMEELLGVQQATNLAAAAAAVCSAAACPAGHRRGRRRAASAGAATGSPGRAAELPDAV